MVNKQLDSHLIKLLNTNYGCSIDCLANWYKVRNSTIQAIVGSSALKYCEATEDKVMSYNSHLFLEAEYFADCSRFKQNDLTSHDYATLKNFPIVRLLVNTHNQIVNYQLAPFHSESGNDYLELILSANVDKSKVIHVDTSSKSVLEALTQLGYKVCYVSKKERLEIYAKAYPLVKMPPYLTVIEHWFGILAKQFRPLINPLELRDLDNNNALVIADAVIQKAWFKNLEPIINLALIELKSSCVEQPLIENVNTQSLKANQLITA